MNWGFLVTNWEFFVYVVILCLGLIAVKKKIGAPAGSRTRKLVWQYFFAASLALITATVLGQLELTWSVMIALFIGAFNIFWEFLVVLVANWEFLACIAVLYSYGFASFVTKKIGAPAGSRTRKLVWQYFFAASLALITATVLGQLELTWSVMIVMVIGAFNAFGCYCHWRAYDISMSRTSMLSNLDDLIAMGLGYIILGELGELTPILTVGVIVSVISATIFARIKRPDETKDGNSSLGETKKGKLMGWVLSYSIIWGFAMFSMRYFSVQKMSLPTYIAAWYTGSWFGALFTRFVIMRFTLSLVIKKRDKDEADQSPTFARLAKPIKSFAVSFAIKAKKLLLSSLVFKKRDKDEAGPPLMFVQLVKVSLLAIVIWTKLILSYWMREIVPITVIQPIQLVAEMSIPVIIAIIFFGELRNMSRKEIFVIAGGLIGIALVAIGY